MNPTVERLRQLLAAEREARQSLKADLQTARQREQQLRADVARLQQRLADLGEPEVPAHRSGYARCDAAIRERMVALHQIGQSYSQIGRRLGFSTATVSLVCRGKYPAGSRSNRQKSA